MTVPRPPREPGDPPAAQGRPRLPAALARRRGVLAGLGVLALGAVGATAFYDRNDGDDDGDVDAARGPARRLVLSLGQSARADAVLPAAEQNGIFAHYNLDVVVRHHDNRRQVLADLQAGRIDAVAAPALEWLPALQNGLDAKLVSGLHAGGARLLATRHGGLRRIEDCNGRAIGVTDAGAPEVTFFSVLMRRKGMQPATQIRWVPAPAMRLGEMLLAGQVDAVAAPDPLAWQLRDALKLTEVAAQDMGSYRERVNCVLGVRGSLLRDDRATVAALVHAVQDAAHWVARHPDEAAALLAPQIPDLAPKAVAALLRSEGQDVHPIGPDLREQIAQYADELKLLGQFPDTMHSGLFARHVCQDLPVA